MDVRFLNYLQAPLFSPLHRSMKIDMYSEIYFQPIKFSFNRAIKDEASNQDDSKAFKLDQNKPKIPSMTEIFQ